jgi:hypothetical protein
MRRSKWNIIMAEQPARRGIQIAAGLWLASCAATVAILFLIVPAGQREGKFWLTLVTLLIAEGVVAGYGILALYGWARVRQNFPTRAAVGQWTLVYAIGVMALALVAATPLDLPWLLVLHILWALAFVFGAGLIALVSGFLREQSGSQRQQRLNWSVLVDDLAIRRRQVAELNGADFDPLRRLMDKAYEGARYAASDSTVEAGPIEVELNQLLAEMKQSLAAPATETGVQPTAGGLLQPEPVKVQSLTILAQKIIDVLDRRERIIARSRQVTES